LIFQQFVICQNFLDKELEALADLLPGIDELILARCGMTSKNVCCIVNGLSRYSSKVKDQFHNIYISFQ